MGDIRIKFDQATGTGDFNMLGPALELGQDLETAVLISLFTDAQADPGDIVLDNDPRGWWADTYSAFEDPALTTIPNDRIGSKLWQIFARPRNQDTLNWMRDISLAALRWMITDGVADQITVQPMFTSSGGVGEIITIVKNGIPTVYDYAWGQDTSGPNIFTGNFNRDFNKDFA